MLDIIHIFHFDKFRINFNSGRVLIMLSSALMLMTACADLSNLDSGGTEVVSSGSGVLVLCEGNYNSGNASLSYYNPETKQVENGVFKRVNSRKLGDTGQSILVSTSTSSSQSSGVSGTATDEHAYIAVENSGIIWDINTQSFKVNRSLTSGNGNQMIDPRYICKISDTKAYVSDLYSHYISIFNPKTMTSLGSISVDKVASNGYCSTEEMVKWENYVFVCCWSYSNKILVIDTNTDAVVKTISLSSCQPKSICLDKNAKLWVITDGGYTTEGSNGSNDSNGSSYGDNLPHLYKIDAATCDIELDFPLSTDETNVQLALNNAADALYILNNGVYRMSVSATSLPTSPIISVPVDADGTKHVLYGLGVNPKNEEVYVADAVDYKQAGVVYRYSSGGVLIDQFKVGIIPNHFAFTNGNSGDIPGEDEPKKDYSHNLVNKIYEYMPAPGHQVNGYTIVGDMIRSGATMEEACDTVLSHFKKQWMVSLGAQGGYVIAGWDHNVTISGGDYDIAIKGNPYSYQNEPGIIWVMQDTNGNGLPDDTWYELKGSEYGTANETLNYAITYYKPTAAKQDIEWVDNQGGSGIVPYAEAWNTHDSYWQDWVPTEKDGQGREYHTYYGSRLKDTHTYENGATNEPAFSWGYADNGGSDYFTNSSFGAVSGSSGYYKISNAVTADGQPANLQYINFIKIQTAQTGYSPNLYDISTEVYGIWSLK